MSNVIKYSPKPTIYGTGLIALDIVISSNLNEPAYNWAGGTCGNVLTILSYLGWNSFPIARLNKETSSLKVISDLKKWKVRLDYIGMYPVASVPVITQEIIKDKKGISKHKFHWKNCPKCGSWLPNYKPVTLSAIESVTEKVMDGDVYFFDRTSPGALKLAKHFKDLGCVIYFEPSAKGDPKQFIEAVQIADIIKYSKHRFESISTYINSDIHPFIEIQTLADNGIRYRLKGNKRWIYFDAFHVKEVVDSCGSGDWTTAGIIYQLCGKGLKALQNESQEIIESGLKYGQALGAWNCGFEGARGGMYRISKQQFHKEIDLILNGEVAPSKRRGKNSISKYVSDGLCPSCPASV